MKIDYNKMNPIDLYRLDRKIIELANNTLSKDDKHRRKNVSVLQQKSTR